MGPYVTPVPPPAGWESTVAPGAQAVVVEAIAPGAISSGEIAILAVCIFGFSLVLVVLLVQLIKRTR